jgi:predicted MPP superfamily phosphohydrolase
MQHPELISILHISDFHFTKRKDADQRVVVEALEADLRSLCIGHRKPDLVVFSGDLVHAAGADSHDEAYDFLLSRVGLVTGCSDQRIYVAPGNHDAARTSIEREADLHRNWRNLANKQEEMNRLFAESAFSELAAKKFDGFNSLEKYLRGEECVFENDFVKVYHPVGIGVEVMVINTAMLSTAGHDKIDQGFKNDKGFLSVPEHSILPAIKYLTPQSFKIICTHHPLGYLAESAERFLKSVIEKHANMHLFGHMHDPQPSHIVVPKGAIYSNQSGAVFTQRTGAYIGYSLISVDLSKHFYETHLRTYFDDRKCFDDAVDVIENGRFYSSQESRVFWRGIAQPVNETEFVKHLGDACLAEHKKEMEATENGKVNGDDSFIHPRLRRTSMKSTSGRTQQSNVETAVTFDELLNGVEHTVIYAAPEYGRTTLLKMFRISTLANSEKHSFPRFPVLIDFEDIKHNTSGLLRTVKSRAILPPENIDLESLLKLGRLCLLVDDIDFSDAKRMKILREFVSSYPKVRYIFSSARNSAAPFGAHVDPEMHITFDFLELCVLRRSDMRQLVSKYKGGKDTDVLLDRLQEEFQELNIPFTAANGTILMTILEEQSGFKPMNRSVLVEQFVDSALRKAAVEQSQREVFDYKNKTSLLAHVAAWMARVNNYRPTTEEVRDVTKNYFDKLGLNAPIDELLKEFHVARIFVKRPENRLSFRYRAVLEYFVALEMENDPSFKDWVLQEEQYLQYPNEIQYYAGRVRKDAGLLEVVGERFLAILDQLYVDIGGVIDLDQLTGLKLPDKGQNSSVERLSLQLSAPPLNPDEKDVELEATLPKDVEDRQEVFRPRIVDPGQKLLVSLTVYSGLLKNLELIDDSAKRQHLSQLWKGWGIFLHLSLSVVPDLAKHRKVRINGVLYEINAPVSMSDSELARLIALNMPVGITRLLSATMGTEKLERQLVEPSLDDTHKPLVFEFLRTAVIADLKLPSTASSLKTALSVLAPSAYLLEAMTWKIAELRRMDRLRSEDFEAVKHDVASAIVKLSENRRITTNKARPSKSELQSQRESITHKLEKESLVLRLRKIHSSEE